MKNILLLVLSLIVLINVVALAVYPKHAIPVYKAMTKLLPQEKATTPAEIQVIFKGLVAQLPMKYNSRFTLRVLEIPQVGAATSPLGEVMITREMLKLMEHDAGSIAAVLGHELGHHVLEHFTLFTTDKSSLQRRMGAFRELNADKLGLTIAIAAGYNGCNVVEVWKKYAVIEGIPMRSSSHPTHSYRADALNNICKNII